jgi:2,3-bisphosphoglycerate-dependent phosphoglycerate mutase
VTPDYQGAFVLPPGATEVILVRHGSAQHQQARPFELVGGQSDPPLAPRGHDQSRALAQRLAGEPVAAIFITPLRRTTQTATPLAERLGIRPIVVPELREVHLGSWEADGGFGVGGPDRDALRHRVLEQEEWGLIPGAEDVLSFGERVGVGLEQVARELGPNAVGVAIVHGGVVAEACHQITASRPFAFFGTENGSITRVVRHEGGRWTLQAFNETAHLR